MPCSTEVLGPRPYDSRATTETKQPPNYAVNAQANRLSTLSKAQPRLGPPNLNVQLVQQCCDAAALAKANGPRKLDALQNLSGMLYKPAVEPICAGPRLGCRRLLTLESSIAMSRLAG